MNNLREGLFFRWLGKVMKIILQEYPCNLRACLKKVVLPPVFKTLNLDFDLKSYFNTIRQTLFIVHNYVCYILQQKGQTGIL